MQKYYFPYAGPFKKITVYLCALCGLINLLLGLSIIPSFAADKVFYYHTDATGTPMAMTDSSGNVVWQADYKPFGEEHTVSGSVDNKNKFIGKEKDEETDLYYFGARYLDARSGRFIKPDPVGIRESDLTNPQRINRYAYSLNNPYRYVDPDGREVQLTSHAVFTVNRHTALLLIPDNQSIDWGARGFKKNSEGKWYATLSAGPDSVVNPKLKSDINRPTDDIRNNSKEAVVVNPYGKTAQDDTKFIKSLIEKDANYRDNLDYDFLPIYLDGYNSNSYISGLLKSVGAKTPYPKTYGNYPGLSKPVPEENFQ